MHRPRVELLRDRATPAAEFAALYGQEYLAEPRRQDPEQVVREVVSLLHKARDEHGDVPVDSGTVGARAGRELFELTHLVVGKGAPDIEGEDRHGQRFTLRDYRGKVVLLDFWSYV